MTGVPFAKARNWSIFDYLSQVGKGRGDFRRLLSQEKQRGTENSNRRGWFAVPNSPPPTYKNKQSIAKIAYHRHASFRWHSACWPISITATSVRPRRRRESYDHWSFFSAVSDWRKWNRPTLAYYAHCRLWICRACSGKTTATPLSSCFPSLYPHFPKYRPSQIRPNWADVTPVNGSLDFQMFSNNS